MNRRTSRWPSRLAILGLVIAFAVGCSSGPEAEPDSTPEVHADAPDPEVLAAHPCGQEDWDEPPPEVSSLKEREDREELEEPEDQESPKEAEDDDETPADDSVESPDEESETADDTADDTD